MDDKTIDDYASLITSQHKHKERFNLMIKAVSQPMIDCFNFLKNLNSKYDVENSDDPYLETLARWTGAPLIIPGAAQLEYFGFDDQENALTFGEIGDPSVGGYFRESGQSGTGGLVPTGEFLRRLIQAKILKNHSTGNIRETKQILSLALNHDQFKVMDNNDMTVSFINLAPQITATDKILVRMFFPLPSGVELLIEG
ncbi:DUF2612 domain-containing protein [Acinetobacter towneri]|uniref:DUF2612 domain-containing protein n=1 Tax=Acinetobacter towneri TaxID=202956 RepID=UPI001CE16959|nr:DUF2612 domain-containing protein [Acinetobacter towneri]MCA4780475.1 DUF2612 domain-containing protein [Acinetobacter towneri]MCA4785804.1 DUF2612 domain-containing protein [Acinetobacter towneri]MCA4787466.1 DUF2612 domain-containing protein [Acinetobacter towneri]MCA4796936.1 DUF2612 domain-containing protein [Acinetobacter towneri]MCA4802031.1 DUF2612 domain-containing protein [Acinetobacter towneri]